MTSGIQHRNIHLFLGAPFDRYDVILYMHYIFSPETRNFSGDDHIRHL